ESHDDRHRRACAPPLLRRDRDQMIPCARDEVGELHLGHRPQPHHRGAGAGADDRGLREGRVDDAPRAELLLEAERDLERAAVDADVLSDQEDALVPAHLDAERVRDRLQVRELGHYLWWGVSRSSTAAYTPSKRSFGSGMGEPSARWSASFRSFFTPLPISSSSSSVMSTFVRSQVRKRSSGSDSAHFSNITFGTQNASSCTAWPSMRSVRHSSSVGPPPERAFSIARFASRYTASTSVPSTTTP